MTQPIPTIEVPHDHPVAALMPGGRMHRSCCDECEAEWAVKLWLTGRKLCAVHWLAEQERLLTHE